MSVELIIYFALLALLAEVLGTIGGFGSSLFFIPIAGLFLDFHSVLGITAIFHVISNISKISLFKNGIDWKMVISIGIPSVIFVIVGAFMTRYFQPKWLELILAVFLLLLSSVLFFFPKISFKPNTGNAIGGGAVSGFLAGIVGTGGAIRGLLLSTYDIPVATFIATSAMIDFGIDLSRSVVYFFNGYVHSHDMYLIPVLALVSFIGTYIGKQILTKLSLKQFKKAVLILVFITGLFTIYKTYFNS